jgi:arylsulfatase A-like enzyme
LAVVVVSGLFENYLVRRAEGNEDGQRPNIVLILSDDQGYADVSCYEHPKEVLTPHIDRLAEEGVRCTNGYASANVCAPTRAGLLTGRYQERFGFYTASDSRTGMPLDEITVADVLRKAGYVTGVFGKWHLGIEAEYHPLKRGFDEFYGFLGHGAHDYFNLSRTEAYNSIYRNDKIIDDTGYLTDNLARESVRFIERHHKKPFFLYLPFNAVHWPLQAPAADIKRFNTGDKERDILMGMLWRMDVAVGEVLKALKRTGADKNALIIYFSDNGGALRNKSNNGVLCGYKHMVYEGGLRVPFIVSWVGKLPEGTVCQEPVMSIDIMPTICAAVGIALPSDRIYDGKNMLPVLRGEAKKRLHEELFWDNGLGKWAVRAGKWKLLKEKGGLELYDLEADIGEKNNLAERHPQMVEDLQKKYRGWKSQMAPRIKKVREGKGDSKDDGPGKKGRKNKKNRNKKRKARSGASGG